MNQKATQHELLLLTHTGIKKHSCKKNCDKAGHSCPLQMQQWGCQGKSLLKLLMNITEGSPERTDGEAFKVTQASNFVHLNIGGPISQVNSEALNPHFFLPLKNSN